jgi:3-dehydroquinate dehydratase type I
LFEKTLTDLIVSCVSAKSKGADIIEVRLDFLTEQLTNSILDGLYDVRQNVDVPFIVTIRPTFEGGRFSEGEDERTALLSYAISKKFDYVDIELSMEDGIRRKLMESARGSEVKSIISSHDFKTKPSKEEILDRINECHNLKGDFAKVVCECQSIDDAQNVLWAAMVVKNMKLPYSIMGTGPFGHITRILGPVMGSRIVYTSLDFGSESQEGQVPITPLKGIWDILGL